jgi:tetratricopeptide (TPR) repeat protein
MKVKNFLLLTGLSFIYFCPLVAQDPDSLLESAGDAFQNGQYGQALEQYLNVLTITSDDSINRSLAYGYAGACSEELGENKDALSYYKEAILLQVPRLLIYDKMISLAKQEKDNPAYEFALLQKMLAFPDFEVAVSQSLAYHYFNTKQYDKLLAIIKQLTDWFPGEAKFHYFDAIAKQNQDDLEGARNSFLAVLEIEHSHSGANMGIGMILYNEASDLFDRAVKEYESIANPDRVDYYNYMKKIEKPQSIYREAIPYLLKAYEDPAYSGLRAAIYNAYMRLEDMENANKYKK